MADNSASSAGVERYGLTKIWPPDDIKIDSTVDIVAVHGLGGHPADTWTDGKVFWLRDFLPREIREARIFTWGYAADWKFQSNVATIDDLGRQLVERLRARRARQPPAKTRPLIFICHSLGGIIVKKALITAHERTAHYGEFLSAVKGILFMGTPHRGADIAFWGSLLSRIAKIPLIQVNRSQLVADLERQSSTLGNICSQFVERAQSLKIYTYYERQITQGVGGLVVDEHSALLHIPNELAIPVNEDHRGICRFISKESDRFQQVLEHLLELIEEMESLDSDDNQLRRNAVAAKSILFQLPEFDLAAHRTRIPNHSSGTHAWLRNDLSVSDFLKPPRSMLLWIHGFAGSGKSVLMKHLVSIVEGDGQAAYTNICIPIFCGHISRSITAIDLLYFIAASAIASTRHLSIKVFERVHERFGALERSLGRGKRADGATLMSLVNEIVAGARGHVLWIFIDALDELEMTDSLDVISHMVALMERGAGRIKIAVSHRKTPLVVAPDLPPAFVRSTNLDRNAVYQDVEHYISTQVASFSRKHDIPLSFRTQIESTMVEKASGSFLYTSLALAKFSSFSSEWSAESLQEQLAGIESLPERDDLYLRVLLDIDSNSVKQVRKALFWLLGYERPLTVEEIAFVLYLRDHDTSATSVLRRIPFDFHTRFLSQIDLLIKVNGDKTVTFRHQTTRDFLLSDSAEHLGDIEKARLRSLQSTIEERAQEISRVMRVILAFDYSGLFEDDTLDHIESGQQIDQEVSTYIENARILPFKFLEDWTRYLSDDDQEALIERFFLSPKFKLSHSLWVAKRSHLFSIRDLPLLLSSREPILHALLDMGDFPEPVSYLVNQQGEDTHKKVVTKLDYKPASAIERAFSRQRWNSFRKIIGCAHTTLHSHRLTASPIYDMYRFLAERGDITGFEEAWCLLAKDSRTNANATDDEDDTVLHHIAKDGELGEKLLIPLLTRSDICFDIFNKKGLTAYHVALSSVKGPGIAKLFIQLPSSRFNSLLTTKAGVHPATLIAGRGLDELTELLERKDPELRYQVAYDGFNDFTRAAFFGRKVLFEKLLENADKHLLLKSCRDQAHKYDLSLLCARQDWDDVLHQLRAAGIESTAQDETRHQSVLHYAAVSGWSYSQRLVSEAQKTMANQRDIHGQTPLHLAAEHRNAASVSFLLSIGADVLIRDKYGMNAVYIAARAGAKAVLEIFLSRPIAEFNRDILGRGLLHYIVMWEWPNILELYMKRRKVIVDIKDRQRRTPLHIASIFGNVQMVIALLQRGARSGMRDHIGFSPLFHGIRENHAQVFTALRIHGAKLTVFDAFNRNAWEISRHLEDSDLRSILTPAQFDFREHRFPRLCDGTEAFTMQDWLGRALASRGFRSVEDVRRRWSSDSNVDQNAPIDGSWALITTDQLERLQRQHEEDKKAQMQNSTAMRPRQSRSSGTRTSSWTFRPKPPQPNPSRRKLSQMRRSDDEESY